MAQSREFPAFISVEYSRDAAGFPAFERDATASFERASASIRKTEQEFSALRNTLGQLSREAREASAVLSFATQSGARNEAAVQARDTAKALRERADAARQVAEQDGKYSSAASLAKRLNDEAVAAERAAAALSEEAAILTRVQGILDQNARAARSASQAMRELYGDQIAAANAEVAARSANARFFGLAGGGGRSAGSARESAAAIEAAMAAEERAVEQAAQAWRELAAAQDIAARQASETRRALASQSAFNLAPDVDKFRANFEEIKRIAQGAGLSEAGNLNINAGQYREAAQAASAQAIALREIAVAAERAARANGDTSQATRLYVQAARAAAVEAESNARATTQQATAMERLQTELNQTRSATANLINVEKQRNVGLFRGEGGLRAQRLAMVQTGQQLQDLAIQLGSGQSAAIAFGQQLPQLAYSMQGFGGKVGAVATTLSGPWGLAIAGGSFLLGGLIDRLMHTSDAMDGQKAAAQSLEAAILELNKASGQEIQTQQQAAVAAFQVAVNLREQEIRTRNLTKAKLDAALVDLRVARTRSQAPGQRGELAALGMDVSQGRVEALEAQLAQQDKAIAAAQQAVRNKSIAIIDARVKANLDPLAKAQAAFEKTQGSLRKAYSQGKISAQDYAAGVAQAQRTLDAAAESAKKAGASTKGHAAANRESAAATREAARAQRELESTLASIVGQFDPARAAAQDYANTLSDIARLHAGGKLNDNDKFAYEAEAARRARKEAEDRRQQAARDFYKEYGVDAADSMREAIDGGERLHDAMRGVGRAGGEAFRQSGEAAARDIANLFGAQLRGGLGGILSLLASPQGALSDYDKGRADFLRPLRDVAASITRTFSKGGSFDRILGGLVTGAQIGQMASGLFLGSGGSKGGSAIGGALGGVLGKSIGPALGKAVGGSLGKLLGSAAGPLGSIAGGILGGAIGGLFKKHKIGFATIGGTANGTLGITSTGGNTSAYRQGGVQAANATIDSLAKIAEMLGGTYDPSRGSVSIGQSGDSWHVDTSGQGRLRKSQGGFDFNQDYEAAVKFATMDLIKDGVIQGLRASTNRLLQNSKDLDAAIDKASKFESVFTRLLEYTNPVQAALDGVNKEFTSLNALFKEAGASAAEFADLEELYGRERAKAIKDATAQMTASLKSLIADLTVNNDARSLRERLAAAEAVYNPLAAKAAAGTLTNDETDEFTEAARNLLDIQRQLSGSQKDYFDRENSILAMTQKALDAQQALIDVATGATTPFDANSPSSAASTTQPVVSAIDQLGNTLLAGLGGPLAAVNDNIARMLQQMKNGSTPLTTSALARLNF